MSRTPVALLPQTLTFLIEEHRVCEAEALVHLLSEGGATAAWTPALEAAFRAQLRTQVLDPGSHPLFPLLYLRNNQIPRAIATFEREVFGATDLPVRAQVEAFLEMLRWLSLKRRVPLAAFQSGKLKRDRVNLISQEKFERARLRLFALGERLLESLGHPEAAYAIATEPAWVVYPILREFLETAIATRRTLGDAPAWLLPIELRIRIYSEDLDQLQTLAPRIGEAGLASEESALLERRYARQIERLTELRRREAVRAAQDQAYLAEVGPAWLNRLQELPILERQPRAWEEYQDLRDTQAPVAVGTAADILAALPRTSTYTIWEVGQLLEFEAAKTIRIRKLKGKVRKVSPDEAIAYACPCLEHFTVEEGIGQEVMIHWVLVRLKDTTWALFNLSPRQPGEPAS